MATRGRRRRPDSYPFPLEAWPKDRICFTIVLSFPFPAQATVSREEIAAAVRDLGFIPDGGRFGIAMVMGSVQDLITAGVWRELREIEERRQAYARQSERVGGALMVHDEATRG